MVLSDPTGATAWMWRKNTGEKLRVSKKNLHEAAAHASSNDTLLPNGATQHHFHSITILSCPLLDSIFGFFYLLYFVQQIMQIEQIFEETKSLILKESIDF